MIKSYILGRIDRNGYIRAEAEYNWSDGMGYTYEECSQKSSIIHRESIKLDRQDSLRCFARLEMAKPEWEAQASDCEAMSSQGLILGLNDMGAVEAIYCAPTQEPVVKNRLKIWSACYGAWPVRKLNA